MKCCCLQGSEPWSKEKWQCPLHTCIHYGLSASACDLFTARERCGSFVQTTGCILYAVRTLVFFVSHCLPVFPGRAPLCPNHYRCPPPSSEQKKHRQNVINAQWQFYKHMLCILCLINTDVLVIKSSIPFDLTTLSWCSSFTGTLSRIYSPSSDLHPLTLNPTAAPNWQLFTLQH